VFRQLPNGSRPHQRVLPREGLTGYEGVAEELVDGTHVPFRFRARVKEIGHAVQEKVSGLLSWRSVASLRSVARDLANFRPGSGGTLDIVANEQSAFGAIPLQQ